MGGIRETGCVLGGTVGVLEGSAGVLEGIGRVLDRIFNVPGGTKGVFVGAGGVLGGSKCVFRVRTALAGTAGGCFGSLLVRSLGTLDDIDWEGVTIGGVSDTLDCVGAAGL